MPQISLRNRRPAQAIHLAVELPILPQSCLPECPSALHLPADHNAKGSGSRSRQSQGKVQTCPFDHIAHLHLLHHIISWFSNACSCPADAAQHLPSTCQCQHRYPASSLTLTGYCPGPGDCAAVLCGRSYRVPTVRARPDPGRRHSNPADGAVRVKSR